MKAQIIQTEAGEELIVLTRREYDLLLARGGDEDAEDRATLHVAERVRSEIAAGQDSWLVWPTDKSPEA